MSETVFPIVIEHGPSQQYWTIKESMEVEGRYIKQTAEPGTFGIVTLRFEPYDGPEPIVLIDGTEGRSSPYGPHDYVQPIPQSFIDGVVEGITNYLSDKMDEVALIGIQITLTRLDIHPIDSKPSSYVWAAHFAMRQWMQNAVLIETSGPTSNA